MARPNGKPTTGASGTQSEHSPQGAGGDWRSYNQKIARAQNSSHRRPACRDKKWTQLRVGDIPDG
jgi:hypothetical protein